MEPKAHFVRWFNNINKEDLSIVGSKAASLGDIYNQGFPVPNGFVITPSAYYHFLKDNKLDVKIKHILSTANFDHLHSLHQISGIIKRLIAQASYPNELVSEIILAYKKLKEPVVAIKFSEVSDKHLKSDFIQYPQAILNIQGDAVLLEKIKQVWASVFDSREIFYYLQ